MDIVFSDHFYDKWEEREKVFQENNITVDKIKDYILFPDFTLPDDIFENREWKIKKINKRCLKIVVEQEREHIRVITVYFDRTLKRKGLCE